VIFDKKRCRVLWNSKEKPYLTLSLSHNKIEHISRETMEHLNRLVTDLYLSNNPLKEKTQSSLLKIMGEKANPDRPDPFCTHNN